MKIEIKELFKTYYNRQVLYIPQLTIYPGQITGIVGSNGAGKTTLFRLMLDLTDATKGEIMLDTFKIGKNDDWKKYTGAFIDESFLVPFLTPKEYFNLLASQYGLSKTDLESRLNALKMLSAEELLNTSQYIRDLSKGNTKKVGIIAAFLNNPQLIILDEPFDNLDPTIQYALKSFISVYSKEKNASILVSSHNIDFVTEVSDRIIVLENGSVIKDLVDKSLFESELKTYFQVGA
jgi:ABC-2 type transport system ATP-binding protein